MSVVRTPATFSLEQYFAVEEMSDTRHEYVDGLIYAMVGGTLAHARLCRNVLTSLANRLKRRPCEALGGELRVFISAAQVATYPDVAVYCGPIQMHGKRQDTAVNPVLLVEVLSKSTRLYDRGEKFELYQQLESLKQYVLVHQDRAMVEVFTRLEPGVWQPLLVRGMDAKAPLECLEVQLPLQDIYDGVTLET